MTFTLVAVAVAHFEPDGSVPKPASTTAVGDPKANQGETGPKPGSPAAAAQSNPQPTSTPTPGSSSSGAKGGAAAQSNPQPTSTPTQGSSSPGATGGAATQNNTQPTSTPTQGSSSPGAAGATAPRTGGAAPTSSPASSGAASTREPTPAAARSSTAPESSSDTSAADSSSSPDAASASDEPSSSSSSAPDSGDDGSACFPSDATVLTSDGTVKMMSDLAIGDKVLVSDATFADVFMFTHKVDNVVIDFVRVQTVSGASIRLTSGHYIYVNGGNLVPASALKIGDSLETSSGAADAVVSLSMVKGTGLYNPQTVHGDIVVDGFRASTYTKAVHPVLAHGLLAPLRTLYNRFGLFTSVLDVGSDSLASIVPSGAATC